jgi:hypothetical protein
MSATSPQPIALIRRLARPTLCIERHCHFRQVSPFYCVASPQLPLDAYLNAVTKASALSMPASFSIEFQTGSLFSIGIITNPSKHSSAPSILQPELLSSEFKTIVLQFLPDSVALSSNDVILKSISECTRTQLSADSSVILSYNPSRTVSPPCHAIFPQCDTMSFAHSCMRDVRLEVGTGIGYQALVSHHRGSGTRGQAFCSGEQLNARCKESVIGHSTLFIYQMSSLLPSFKFET